MASLSSLRAVTQAAGLGGQLELPFGIDYAPKVVRDHGLQETHTYPLVSVNRGTSFRVHARQAWDYPSLELRAANSWPALTLDCDVPSAVVDCLYWNHHGGDGPALPRPSVVVEREGQFSLPCKLVSRSASSPRRISTGRTDEEVGADHRVLQGSAQG